MTIRAKIKGVLEADTTLTGILTGGIYDASELPQDGLTPEAVPGAYSGVRLLPCAVIRFSTRSETQIVGASKRQFFFIWFYQHVGYDQIELAMARCRALLHPHVQHKTTGGKVIYTTFVDDDADLVADELDGAAMARSRFYVDYVEV